LKNEIKNVCHRKLKAFFSLDLIVKVSEEGNVRALNNASFFIKDLSEKCFNFFFFPALHYNQNKVIYYL
jgi:ribosome-binding factor A